MKAVLCIGGLDPAGRAGLLADARAVEAAGARPLCVAAALTFQSSRRVDGFAAVCPSQLERQIAVLLRDEPVAAVKTGMLATPENVATVAALVGHLPLVVDTPLVSSSGAPLFPPGQRAAWAPLLEQATLATPNLPEVFLLSGHEPVDDANLAEQLGSRLAEAVLLKGGHAPGDCVRDVLLAGGRRREWSGPRLPGRFRGTGCRLAAAVAARLALGAALEDAVEGARTWLRGQLAAGSEARGLP